MLPLYTHPSYRWFWQDLQIRALLEKRFQELGSFIKSKQVLVSFHPGQFVVLASDRQEVVDRSIEEFEYHVDMARWMGFGKSFQDGCKVNVHIGGKLGPAGIKEVYNKLSLEARNLLTIENDEFSWDLDSILDLKDTVALVLDVHHHWISTGEYIKPNDDRVKQVIDSWKGKIPTMHYSLSPESLLIDNLKHSPLELAKLEDLLSIGTTKSQLRAHSDYYWNTAANDWVAAFSDNFNIMCEAKTKHNAAVQLFNTINPTCKVVLS